MRRLAIIPNDPIELYLSSGYTAPWLKDYFNPCGFFDEVYSLASYERTPGLAAGVIVMPTPAEALPARLRALQIDVVRAYGGAHPCAEAIGAKTGDIPVVVSVHDARPALLDPSIDLADVVLCVSQTVRRLVATRVSHADRVWDLPNRIDFAEMRPYPTADVADLSLRYPFKHKIVHVGRKAWEKNLETIIRSLRRLGPDYCLLAIGQGSTTEYARVAAEEGVSERCFLIDAVANNELARYYSWADCSCTPSRTEAFASVVIEALACGTMVVGSDIPSIRETIVHGENGLLVTDYENPDALAAALRTACTDPAMRRTIMGNARRSVEQYERSRIDALEAAYYDRILDLRRTGAFRMPVQARIQRRLSQAARRISPLKHHVKPLIGR